MSLVFALVDCNNFYVSCERLFDPALEGRPVVVLSNNDGCIVARSNEAKRLNIPMAAPIYQYKKVIEKHKVHVLSSNYSLYGELSKRIMDLLLSFSPDMEVYSIDEAFLRLDSLFAISSFDYALKIKKTIMKHLGLPVSIGLGPTKTLAKVANYMAKNHSVSGVYSVLEWKDQEEVLRGFPLTKLWGVAKRSSLKLNKIGIYDALQLRRAEPSFIRKHLTLTGERLCLEIKGNSCLPLEDLRDKKSIGSSRSFPKDLKLLSEIEVVLANCIFRVCEKLRLQKNFCQSFHLFLQTSPFRKGQKYYCGRTQGSLRYATNDTRIILTAARGLLLEIYRPSLFYHKVGIVLLGLSPSTFVEQTLFETVDHNKAIKLMETVDRINSREGQGKLFIARQKNKDSIQRTGKRKSPSYTGSWFELAKVRC